MKKLSMLEYPIAAVLIFLGLYMMLTGYQKVATHMEQGKNQPFVTNFKHADKEIAARMQVTKPTIDAKSVVVDQTLFEKVYLTNYKRVVELSDVTLGKDMDGHITEGKTKAVVRTDYDETLKRFKLYGTFASMPKLREGFYYEGWLIRKQPFSMISVGKVVLIDEEMTIVYVSDENLSNYTHFVLTLEHNDSNPKPEIQILEGEFAQI
ncbi:MAG: hypothetical protein UZ22_OP11002000625 [Microgenomates bacterium OLB23]|nr:MAG: hypothetical protein UZ22_OP11002000625 [Microgenomates bacterium OLB23]